MKPNYWVWKVSLAVCVIGTVLFGLVTRAAADPIVPAFNVGLRYAGFSDLPLSFSAPMLTMCGEAGCGVFDGNFTRNAADHVAVTFEPRARGREYYPMFVSCAQPTAVAHQAGWDALAMDLGQRAGGRGSWHRSVLSLCSTTTGSLISESDTDDDPVPVPEPATLALLATGLVGTVLRKFRGGRPN